MIDCRWYLHRLRMQVSDGCCYPGSAYSDVAAVAMPVHEVYQLQSREVLGD